MSEPSRRLTVAFIPSEISLFLKMFTFFDVESPVSLTSFKGIKLTCGVDFIYFLSTEARAIAPSTVSFLFAISVYSKEILLPVVSKYL